MNKSISKKAGLPPGALIHIGSRKAKTAKITVLDYNLEECNTIVCQSVEEAFSYRDKDSVSWINVDGLHNVDILSALGENFGLHPLLIEDVLNTKHRPKYEDFEDYIFVTLKMIGINKDNSTIVSEQVSIALGYNWVISFQEREGDILSPLRQRIHSNKGPIRKRGADFLFYRIIDCIVDNYYFVSEFYGGLTEALEEKVLDLPNEESLKEIQNLKKQIMAFKKSVAPLREAMSRLNKDDNNELIKDETYRYLNDVYDHVIQINDSIETLREVVSGIMDLYLTGVSNKMNQVMQVLTIVATIFIPLTFIAGIYGMNFSNMPELQWEYGYISIWILMISIFILMLIYYRKKKWL